MMADNYPQNNNQDNGWMGWVFIATILFIALVIIGLRTLALR